MCGPTVTYLGNPAKDMGDSSASIVKLEAETYRISCTVFMDGSRILLGSEAPP